MDNQGLYDHQYDHDGCGVGAVIKVGGQPSHAIIEQGMQILVNLRHRGAASADDVTGDGAGILFQVPHEFFTVVLQGVGLPLPAPGCYGVGMVFEPKGDQGLAQGCRLLLEQAIKHYGMKVLAWRRVPTDPSCLGPIALAAEPAVSQVFVDGCGLADWSLQRKLFLARKRAERLIREEYGQKAKDFYVLSLSNRTICYKGMFMDRQLFDYYPDLVDDRITSAFAIVHQRYSTNTLPNWRLAQPFRCIAHNGEINTLSGNRNSMRAREAKMACKDLTEDRADLLPVIDPETSDSGAFDNVLELLVMAGRSMPHALMMMVPEAFGPKYHISADKRAFYEYHAAIMEPWDGPAAILFTDGQLVGGTLDRNGLRPCRYTVTVDGLVVMASEAGVIDIPPDRTLETGRLRPGHLFLVDTLEGRIISDNEIKSRVSRQRPYRRWLQENRIELRGLFDTPTLPASDHEQIMQRMRAFGYTREELRMILKPMAIHGQEPVGSMGNDIPLAVLSDRPRLLFDYFKQLFAQVTNPAIDPLREGLVMSLMLFTGKKGNLLDETPQHCRQLKLPHPILTNDDIECLRSVRREDFRVVRLDALFDADAPEPGASLENALEGLIEAAAEAVRKGASMLILSDRKVDAGRAAIPSLLATSAVHHGLVNRGLRTETGIIVESGEPREVMHFCLLCGFGANAVNPYLALEALYDLHRSGELAYEPTQLADNYIAAIKKGILKVMSKMGISTIRSYLYAQLFEAIGLSKELVDRYFTGTTSRIGGVGIDQIAIETIKRHRMAFSQGVVDLDIGGQYAYRRDGERHLWNPQTISKLQHAVRQNDPEAYAQFAQAINEQSRQLYTLRGLLEFTPSQPIPIDQVEPASQIVKRFCTGAMSHGSISKEAHETLAIAMNSIGAMSNTGEGGEDPARYLPSPDGLDRNCAIKQVASGRFGVTINYLAHAKELQIKIAQGAKPGEGGQLPGHKVTEEIARLRYSMPGVTLISPPPHHDIYSIEDLAQLIYDLKCANPDAKVSVKLVAEIGVGTIAAGVAKAGADEVLISGHDGGTGASPWSSIMHAGIPWELGLAEAQQVLVANNLRGRIRVQVDGQLRTGRDVVIAALLGAERFGFGTVALVTLGCTLLRKCHEGMCVFGIATQDPQLRKRFTGRPEYLQRYLFFVAEEVRQWMARLGFRTMDEMIGRVDRLCVRKAVEHWKAKGLDLSAILKVAAFGDGRPIRQVAKQPDRLAGHIDWAIYEKVGPALGGGGPVTLRMPIRNVHRAVGTILSNRICLRHGPGGLPDGSIELVFEGTAGQSFGAFLAPGVTLRLVGQANDYLGKGLSGGRIVVQTPPGALYPAHENIIVGNTVLYGATAGQVFINGVAGERFAVRNSGAIAVVEGIGDHGCEYMTGGIVVVLGKTGCNFAAGMSGGVAFVLDQWQLFDTLCNLDMVELETVWQQEDKRLLENLIRQHLRWTGSAMAKAILDAWPNMVGKFVKVMPIDYRRALERMMDQEQRDADTTPATEEVFHG